MQGVITVDIRIFAISFILCASSAIFPMESYSLKDALELARNLGVQQDDFAAITQALLKESHVSEGSVVILKDTVYETISNLMASRLIEATREPAVPVAQPVAPIKEAPSVAADPFDAQFACGLADMAALVAFGREYEAANDKENSLLIMQGISLLHHSLENEIIKQSKNKWFLTGSLVEKKLRLSETQTVSTNVGLCIPHTFKTNTPLHHLVSHHQIFTSCGFNSLANAYAIERQLKEGVPITAECTRKYAEFCFAYTVAPSVAFKAQLSENGIKFADSEGFGKAADDIARRYNMPLHLIYLSAAELASFKDEITMQPIIKLIKSNPAVHFVYNVGAHWVLVSIVRQKGGYAMYHLNSANDPMDVGQMGPVMTYLDGLISSFAGPSDCAYPGIQARQATTDRMADKRAAKK